MVKPEVSVPEQGGRDAEAHFLVVRAVAGVFRIDIDDVHGEVADRFFILQILAGQRRPGRDTVAGGREGFEHPAVHRGGKGGFRASVDNHEFCGPDAVAGRLEERGESLFPSRVCLSWIVIFSIHVRVDSAHPIDRVLHLIIEDAIPEPGRKDLVAHVRGKMIDPPAVQIQGRRVRPHGFLSAASVFEPPGGVDAALQFGMKRIGPIEVVPTHGRHVREEHDIRIAPPDFGKKVWAEDLRFRREDDEVKGGEGLHGFWIVDGWSRQVRIGGPDEFISIGQRDGAERGEEDRQNKRRCKSGASYPLGKCLTHVFAPPYLPPAPSDSANKVYFSSSTGRRIAPSPAGPVCCGSWCFFATIGAGIRSLSYTALVPPHK